MAGPARLNDILAPSRITAAGRKYLTIGKVWPNGKSSSRLLSSQPLSNFTVEFDGITLTQFNALKVHYDSAKGKHLPFEFVDTHDNTLYIVRYDDDTLNRESAVPNIRGLYKITVNLQEAR